MIQTAITDKLFQGLLNKVASKKIQLASDYPTNAIAWQKFESLMYGNFKKQVQSKPSDKVLAFDMDGTLLMNKNGQRFAKTAEDGQIYNNIVKKKLTSFFDEGYNLVLFTNQKGISTKMTNPVNVMEKIQKLCNEINIPMQVVVATSDDKYRKPQAGMWQFFLERMNQQMKVNLKNSLFCGDSAGRKFFSSWKKNDINDFDLKFAEKIGINFQTPEEFFLEKQVFRLS